MQLASAEKRLTDQRLLNKSYDETYFFKMHLTAHIEDDHIPFIHRGNIYFKYYKYLFIKA